MYDFNLILMDALVDERRRALRAGIHAHRLARRAGSDSRRRAQRRPSRLLRTDGLG